MRRVLFASVGFCVAATMADQLSAAVPRTTVPAVIVRGRDLRAYDYGGSFETPPVSHDIGNVSSLRAFVWNHWSARRKGYVKITLAGKDSYADCYLFIEPRGDAWHIAWETIQYGIGNYTAVQKPNEIVSVRRHDGALLLFGEKKRLVFTL
jgi:hypothetical protein